MTGHRGRRGGGRIPVLKSRDIPGFDAKRMALVYLRRLLPDLEMVDDFFDALLPVLPPEVFAELAQKTALMWMSAPERSRMNSRVDEADIRSVRTYGRSVEDFLDNRALKGGEVALRGVVEELLDEEIDGRPLPDEQFRNRLEELQQIFRIDEEELDVLLFLHTQDQYQGFYSLLRELNIVEMVNIIARSVSVSGSTVRRALSSSGRLARNGLIDEDGIGRRDRIPDIDPTIKEFPLRDGGGQAEGTFCPQGQRETVPAFQFRPSRLIHGGHGQYAHRRGAGSAFAVRHGRERARPNWQGVSAKARR